MRAFLHASELAVLPENSGVRGRSLTQDLEALEHFLAQREFAGLLRVALRQANQYLAQLDARHMPAVAKLSRLREYFRCYFRGKIAA